MQRHEALHQWLKANNAAELWQAKTSKTDTITAYAVNGKLLIVYNMGEDGWDVYIPASESNQIRETLDALDQYVASK